MWHAMFAEQIPFTEKILRTIIIYALIVVLFRLTGKRGMASLSTLDFVVVFLLSNVVQNGRSDISQVETGNLEPGGQLVLTLKHAEQGATKADVADLADRLGRIERLLDPAR